MPKKPTKDKAMEIIELYLAKKKAEDAYEREKKMFAAWAESTGEEQCIQTPLGDVKWFPGLGTTITIPEERVEELREILGDDFERAVKETTVYSPSSEWEEVLKGMDKNTRAKIKRRIDEKPTSSKTNVRPTPETALHLRLRITHEEEEVGEEDGVVIE